MIYGDKISFDEIKYKPLKTNDGNEVEYENAAFTHYIHNHQNGVSKSFKNGAINHVKRALEYKYPKDNITSQVAEDALQYLIFNFHNEIPFPPPKNKSLNSLICLQGLEDFELQCKTLVVNVFTLANGMNKLKKLI